jgi:hypothetical protein
VVGPDLGHDAVLEDGHAELVSEDVSMDSELQGRLVGRLDHIFAIDPGDEVLKDFRQVLG